jgi:cell division protein FtsB
LTFFFVVLRLTLLYCFERVDSKPKSKRRKTERRSPARTQRIAQWLLVFVASVIVVDGLVGERGLLAMMRARKQNDEMTAAIVQLRAENARLREEARRLKEDPGLIEEIARRELGLIRPGEKLFIIKDVQPPKP